MRIPFLPNYQLAHAWWLLLLLGLPLLAWLRGRLGEAPAVSFPAVELLQGLGRRTRSRQGGFWMNLLYASIALAIMALARPQRVISYDEVKTEGIAIVVACDVSLSMLSVAEPSTRNSDLGLRDVVVEFALSWATELDFV